MSSPTYFSITQFRGQPVLISFYKEQPGGWKLNFEYESGASIPGGDKWTETLDDLVLQIGNFTDDDLIWQEEEQIERLSFYDAVKRCVRGCPSSG